MGQVLAVVMLVGGATVQAQPGTARGFDKDASSSFALLAGGAEINFLLGRVGFEKQVEGLHLSKTDGGANLGSWWATYEGENATGRLTTSASFPNMLDKQHNHFWVTFRPPSETPMPQGLLVHLLGKAEKTTIGGGDEISVVLPSETNRNGCWSQYSLTLRLTTGALTSNTVVVMCPVK